MIPFNKKILTVGIVIGVIFLLLIGFFIWYVSAKNKFIALDEGVQEQWAKVEVQYQRRLDLIPNLVNTVKGYAEHESNTFETVTRARAGLTDAYNEALSESENNTVAPVDDQAMARFSDSQRRLADALNIYVNAVHEAYPDLKADTQFLDLQAQLEGTENRIATERGRYTDKVKEYNVAVRSFPGSFVAGLAGFSPKPQFQAESQASKAPTVTF